MAKRDYYEILGIEREADLKRIKQAYRRLAMELHPDRNPDDPRAEERFKEAAEAYAVLSNPEKRQIYDRYGHDGLHGQPGFSEVDDIFSSFGDIFSEFFGGDLFGSRRRSRPPRPPRGADLRYDLRLSFAESLTGTKRSIELKQLRRCPDCDGSGAAPGTQPDVCTDCGGRGQVIQRTGFMTLTTTCPRCRGRGTTVREPCGNCSGAGRAPFTRTVSATVPAGVDSGMRLRIAQEGEHPESEGDPGDLYIFIEVEPDERFERHGNDLHCEVEIPFTRAILGHTARVTLLGEDIDVPVAPGTQPGDSVRLAERGVPYVSRSGAGDLVVHFVVTLPREVDDEQRELLARFERSLEQDD